MPRYKRKEPEPEPEEASLTPSVLPYCPSYTIYITKEEAARLADPLCLEALSQMQVGQLGINFDEERKVISVQSVNVPPEVQALELSSIVKVGDVCEEIRGFSCYKADGDFVSTMIAQCIKSRTCFNLVFSSSSNRKRRPGSRGVQGAMDDKEEDQVTEDEYEVTEDEDEVDEELVAQIQTELQKLHETTSTSTTSSSSSASNTADPGSAVLAVRTVSEGGELYAQAGRIASIFARHEPDNYRDCHSLADKVKMALRIQKRLQPPLVAETDLPSHFFKTVLGIPFSVLAA